MSDNGEKALEELTLILQSYTALLGSAEPEAIEEGLLVLHRVVLILVEVHERTMKECGLTPEQLENNREVLARACEIVENELAHGVNMPGGDA